MVIETVEAADLDLVEPLWLAMVAHHRSLVEGDVGVREPAETWRRRRVEYEQWLAGGDAWVLVAVPEPGGAPQGYAAVRIHGGSATFDLGARVGELESLAVAEEARGAGVGSLLIDAARERLRAAGVEQWTVGVVDANEGALRLYERAGFRPFWRTLVGPVG